ncbi:MAG: hypothetical protein HYV09_18775 [Deltaproteobacteria bacterium]|nr:hypothetical protein [Deltaproteobacteria bacterium]
MDLWAWVNDLERRLRKEGHARLADLIDRIPTEVCNDRHDRVDAMVPEALALARSLELPWLELFLRHWWLQSRVLHRMDATALGDAVGLLEFAHRDETRACPQSVCAVQDLASCYGFVDGPGFADDRLEVSREALARIDPSWPCFTCISSEQASAMRDQGRFAEALSFVDAQIARLAEHGEPDAIFDFPRDRVEAFIELGRLDEALSFIDTCERRGRNDAHHRVSRRLDRARVLARLGRCDDAKAQLPAADEIAETPLFYWFWADAAAALVARSALDNDASLGRVLHGFVERLARQGVGRTTLELAELHGRLALERGAPHVARRALAAMERARDVLRRPLDALDRIARLRAAIDAHPAAPVPASSIGEVLATVRSGGGRDPERDLLLLEAARARFPESTPVLLAYAGCAAVMELHDEARTALEDHHRRTADDDVAIRLAELSLGRDEVAVRRVADAHRALAKHDASRAIADWILARDAHARGHFAECRARLDRVLAARPEAVRARVLWADAARRLGDLPGALERLDEVVSRVPEGGGWDWDRMLVATQLGDFARVRDSARRLGFELEGEGPIDEPWGICRVRFDPVDAEDERGGPLEVWAARTGPVTARVIEIARPPHPLRYGDLVAFEATPLNAPPAAGEDAQRHVWVYPWVATLRQGDYRAFEIDGVHPGDEQMKALETALSELGCELQVMSGDEYFVRDGVRDGELPGVFAVVAIPRERGLREVHDLLKRTTSGLPHPLTWIDLAREAGDSDAAAAHLRARDDYGL